MEDLRILQAGAKRQYLEKAKVIAEGYNRIGYHAVALGDTDISLGLEALREIEKLCRFPLLLGNLIDERTSKPVFQESAIVEVAGKRFGLFGLILGTLNPSFLERAAPATRLEDPVAAAGRIVPTLRDKVDFVIAISHANTKENQEIARSVPGIDFIIDPHIQSGNHSMWVMSEDYMRYFGAVIVLTCDGQGSRWGQLDVRFGKPGSLMIDEAEILAERRRLAAIPRERESEREEILALIREAEQYHRVRSREVPLYPHIAEAPEVQVLVDHFRKRTRSPDPTKAVEPARPDLFLGAETCSGCHPDQYAFWKTTDHARAYEALVRTKDEFRHDCLPCHSVGYGVAYLDPHKVGKYRDVQCEVCHGTNPSHPDDPGRWRWGPVNPDRCVVCHNPRLTDVPFDPKKKMAVIACPGLDGPPAKERNQKKEPR